MQGFQGGSSWAVPFPLPTGYLKPRAEEERRVAAEEKKRQDELKRIERELAEGTGVRVGQTCRPPRLWDGHQLLATCMEERGPGGGPGARPQDRTHSLPLMCREFKPSPVRLRGSGM